MPAMLVLGALVLGLAQATPSACNLQQRWQLTDPSTTFGTESRIVVIPSSSELLVASSTPEGILFTASISNGSVTRQLPVTCSQVGSLDFDPSTGLVVISCSDLTVRAYDYASWTQKWSFTTQAGSFEPGRLTIQNTAVYFGDGWGTQYSIDLVSGKLRWAYADPIPNGCYTGVAVVSGIAVFGCDDAAEGSQGLIVGVNDANGSAVWTAQTAGTMRSRPTVSNGIVYIGCGSGFKNSCKNVYAVNPGTGVFVWTYTTGSYVLATPVVYNGLVFVGSNDATFYALDVATGAKRWSWTAASPFPGRAVIQTAASPVRVVVADSSGNLYSFAALTGTLISKCSNATWGPNAVSADLSTAGSLVLVPTVSLGLFAFGAFGEK